MKFQGLHSQWHISLPSSRLRNQIPSDLNAPPPPKNPVAQPGDDETEEEIEEVVEKLQQLNHMRDSTVLWLTILAVIIGGAGVAVPFYLHNRESEKPKEQIVAIHTTPDRSVPIDILIPATAGTNHFYLELRRDGTVLWRRP